MPGSIHFIGWNLSVKYIKFTNIPITIISDKKNHDSYAKDNGTAYTIPTIVSFNNHTNMVTTGNTIVTIFGKNFGVNINYIHEKKVLGTAGSLS